MKCPKCGSKNIEVEDYMGAKCIVCKDCSLDEREQYEQYPEEKKSQKAKGKYTIYKTGGPKRTKR